MRNINSTMVISSVQKLFCCTEKTINNNNKIIIINVRVEICSC